MLSRSFVLMIVAAGCMNAQFNCVIQGIITDNTNSAVPGARVTATNVDTGVARTAETLDDGLYRVLSLAPGMYRIAVHKEGFPAAGLCAFTVHKSQIRAVGLPPRGSLA